jgi:hypothetical protein
MQAGKGRLDRRTILARGVMGVAVLVIVVFAGGRVRPKPVPG